MLKYVQVAPNVVAHWTPPGPALRGTVLFASRSGGYHIHLSPGVYVNWDTGDVRPTPPKRKRRAIFRPMLYTYYPPELQWFDGNGSVGPCVKSPTEGYLRRALDALSAGEKPPVP